MLTRVPSLLLFADMSVLGHRLSRHSTATESAPPPLPLLPPSLPGGHTDGTSDTVEVAQRTNGTILSAADIGFTGRSDDASRLREHHSRYRRRGEGINSTMSFLRHIHEIAEQTYQQNDASGKVQCGSEVL